MSSLPDLPHHPAGSPLSEPVRSAFLAGASLLQARRASLMLRAGEEPLLTVAAAVGLDTELIPAVQVPLGEGIAGLVAAQGITFFGIQDDITFLSLPLVTDRGVEGVLNLSDRLGDQQFNEAHVGPAKLLAAHLAQLLTYTRQVEAQRAAAPDFDRMLVRELARSKRIGQPFTVALVDVAAGTAPPRPPGSAPFADVDQALHRCIRTYDVVSRRGDGSWGIILAPPTDVHLTIADRLVDAVERAVPAAEVKAMVRVGVAHCPRDGMQPGVLVATAQARMEEYGAETMAVRQ